MYMRVRDEISELLQEWLKGDEPAIEFCKLILEVVGTWDDLIDKDKYTPTGMDISNAFSLLLIKLPNNPFYTKHKDDLQPFLEQMVYDWLAANELERQKVLLTSYSLRLSYAPVLARAVYLIGGFEWAILGVQVLYNTITGIEDFNKYTKEHSSEEIKKGEG